MQAEVACKASRQQNCQGRTVAALAALRSRDEIALVLSVEIALVLLVQLEGSRQVACTNHCTLPSTLAGTYRGIGTRNHCSV